MRHGRHESSPPIWGPAATTGPAGRSGWGHSPTGSIARVHQACSFLRRGPASGMFSTRENGPSAPPRPQRADIPQDDGAIRVPASSGGRVRLPTFPAPGTGNSWDATRANRRPLPRDWGVRIFSPWRPRTSLVHAFPESQATILFRGGPSEGRGVLHHCISRGKPGRQYVDSPTTPRIGPLTEVATRSMFPAEWSAGHGFGIS